ncbi:MAG: hypothetical protein GQE15_00675 [Archangiaceae bacterium]|nr:hypothetical protein [Archangiaceae bacterium]
MSTLPHGSTILKQVLGSGLARFIRSRGFSRERSRFTRARPPLTDLLSFSVNRSRYLEQKSFWMIASCRFEGLLPAQLSYELITVREGYDPGDLAVSLAESLRRQLFPDLDELEGPAELGRRLERDHRLLDAATVFRHARLFDEAARLEAAERERRAQIIGL